MLNHLLESLPAVESRRVQSELELVPLGARSVLFEQGQAMEHVYFPLTGLVSLLRKMHDRIAVETGSVGYEGMVGLPVFLGARISDSLGRVEVEGAAWRLSTEAFLQLVEANDGFDSAVRFYIAARMTATLQLAVCNLVHPLRQRCARSLLAIHDHVAADELLLTHEHLAEMLGVRRAGVTAALAVFQARGILTSRRGIITILNRHDLEAESCECGAIIRTSYGLN